MAKEKQGKRYRFTEVACGTRHPDAPKLKDYSNIITVTPGQVFTFGQPLVDGGDRVDEKWLASMLDNKIAEPVDAPQEPVADVVADVPAEPQA